MGFHSAVLGGNLLFNADDGEAGLELWRSDGTLSGTGLLANLNSADLGGSYPTDLTVVGNKIYFYANDGEANGLWSSDGSEAGTVPVLPQMPGEPDSFSPIVEAGGARFFIPSIQGEPSSLWRTDGTPNGTFRVSPSGVRIANRKLVAVGNSVYFVGSDEDHGQELWVTDGTVAGTRLVADLEPGFIGSDPGHLTAFQGRLYFTADTSTARRELWRSDGTEEGTVMVKDIDPFFSSDPDLLTEHAGLLWFTAGDGGDRGRGLWSTDGTAEGTILHELIPGSDGLLAGDMVWDGDRLFLSGGDTNVGIGLWVWDGTPEGAHRISDVVFAQDPFGQSKPVVAGGTLYFLGFQPSSGFTLWKSDGTEAGTGQVFDSSGSPIFEAGYFQAFSGRVFFTTRQSLFQTDGTAAGTFPILELTSPLDSIFQELVSTGPRLFFRKWDPTTGTELWALEEN